MSDSEAKKSGEEASERRTDERHFACFPAHIQRSGGSTRMALIRDLSVSGALLLTREKLAVGDEILLNLYLHEDVSQVRRAVAHVVRVEPRTGDRAEVWHHSTAVQFVEPLSDCEAEIREIAERQEALGVPRD
ncbi:MAG: PilZ domain-containing protein [Minicystis sp.]